MSRWILIALPLLSLAVVATPPAQATRKPRPVPVVATWFSDLHPKVGQRETVEVQFFAGTHDLSGARLLATVWLGRRGVARLTGTTTDRHGKAWARFTVPAAAGGKKLEVTTRVRDGKRLYTGTNSVTVSR